MAIEVSYILITPYSLLKSRTGGIIARLMSRTDLEFIGAQVIPFSKELADDYADMLNDTIGENSVQIAGLLSDYVRKNFPPREDGKNERTLMLLFRGENACDKLIRLAGRFSHRSPRDLRNGETIRDTYSDMVEDKDDPTVIRYFEPAVLTPPNMTVAMMKLKKFADFASNQPNIVDDIVGADTGDDVQRTLVMIKPDNWRHPSSRPGNIMDMLSRTGLKIVGCKVHRMSVSDALDFYGSVRDNLREKLAPNIGEKAREILEAGLGIKLPADTAENLTETVGIPYADDQFSQLIQFMSGRRPEDCKPEDLNVQGAAKCLVLIYEGKDAIKKIRDVLGPTDPTKAPGGTVRRDFGSDIMVNTVHASDSPESVEREMKVIRIHQNSMAARIYEFLAEK